MFDFELSQLNCFVTVAEQLSFRRAATLLHMTQPPLSRQIKLLEHQLRVKLFVRTTRTVTLTPAGKTFLVAARQLLELAAQAGNDARRIASGEFGHLTLSFVACSIYQYLPMLVNRMQQIHPHVTVHLSEKTSTEQFNALRLKQVDIGIVRAIPLAPGIAGRQLLREPFVLAIPASNPLASQKELTLACLHQQPFISYESTSWKPFHDMIDSALHRHNVKPRHTHSIGSTAAILSMVNGGVGMALVPASSADIRFDQVVFRPVSPVEDLFSELLLVWHEENDNPVLPGLVDTLYRTINDVLQSVPSEGEKHLPA